VEFEKVQNIIAEQMNVSLDKITLDTSLTDDLGADSLDIFQTITELEEAFDMEFSNEDSEKIKTVGDIVDYIREKLGE